MSVRRPPGSISPPVGCRDDLQNPPELSFELAAASGQVSWKIMVASMFLGKKIINRRWRQPRGPPLCARAGGEGGWARGAPLGRGLRPPLDCGKPLELPVGLRFHLGV